MLGAIGVDAVRAEQKYAAAMAITGLLEAPAPEYAAEVAASRVFSRSLKDQMERGGANFEFAKVVF